MFNRRIKGGVVVEVCNMAYERRMDDLERAINKIRKQINCDHRAVIFEAASPLGGPPNSKCCADCGKILKYYKTKKEWLEEQLKEERKNTSTNFNTADVTNTETVTDGLSHTDHGIGEDKKDTYTTPASDELDCLHVTIPIRIEQDGDGFHGYVPALKGCRVGGDTVEETRNNLHDAVHLYFDSFDKESK